MFEKKYVDIIKDLFSSEITSYKIAKDNDLSPQFVDNYRSGKYDIENMTLGKAEKLAIYKWSLDDTNKKFNESRERSNQAINKFVQFVIDNQPDNGMEAILWKDGEMEVISENTVDTYNEDFASKVSLDESLFEYDSEEEMREDLDFDIRNEFRGLN